MTSLPQLRLDLADAESRLRIAKDQEATAKTIATLDVVGKNDDERKRNTALALIDQDALTRLRGQCRAPGGGNRRRSRCSHGARAGHPRAQQRGDRPAGAG